MSYFYRLDTNVYYSNSRYIGLITNRHPAAQTGFGYNTTNRKARQFYQNYRAIMAEGASIRAGRVRNARPAGPAGICGVTCGSNPALLLSKDTDPWPVPFLMEKVSRFDRKTINGVHRLFRGVHFERLGALTNRNLDRTKYLFYNIDLFVLRPRILLNYRKEQGLVH